MTENKMLGRIFPRAICIYYVITVVFLLLLFVYEMKQLYHKFQKGRRFAFYNTYEAVQQEKAFIAHLICFAILTQFIFKITFCKVNEVYHFADKLELSQLKSHEQVKGLSKIFKISFKKNGTNEGR